MAERACLRRIDQPAGPAPGAEAAQPVGDLLAEVLAQYAARAERPMRSRQPRRPGSSRPEMPRAAAPRRAGRLVRAAVPTEAV
jgi:hypothetical protein